MTYQMNSLHMDVLLKCIKKILKIIDYFGINGEQKYVCRYDHKKKPDSLATDLLA